MRRWVTLLAVVTVVSAMLGLSVASGQGARQIEKQREKLRQVVAQEGSILAAVEEIDRAVQEQESKLETLRQRQAQVETRMGELEQERQTMEVGLAARRIHLQGRLRALYKYSSKGFLQVMLAGGSGTERLKRVRYLQQIVRRDLELVDHHRQGIARLGAVKNELEVERARVKSVSREVEAQVTAAQEERSRKQALLASIRQEKSMSKQLIQEMTRAARALNRQMETLPAGRSGQSSFSAETGSKAAEEGSARESASDAKPAPVATLRTFRSQRGKLGFPVEGGEVTKAFGRYKAPGMKAYDFHRGVDIVAPSGKPFRAIYGGEVKLAKWFKGYGLLIIIDHGDGYHSIYAHASKLFKKSGEPVRTGEKIGLVGDTGSFQGPYLYLEVRKQGKAVNPLEWIRVPPDALQLK